MEREEKRRNDGVAIKYTTCSGEYAACCRASALWPRVRAPSLHLFLSYFSLQLTACRQFLEKQLHLSLFSPFRPNVMLIFKPLVLA